MKYFFIIIFFFLNVIFYDIIYLAKGFRMRPKVRSTLMSKRFFSLCESTLKAVYTSNVSTPYGETSKVLPCLHTFTGGGDVCGGGVFFFFLLLLFCFYFYLLHMQKYAFMNLYNVMIFVYHALYMFTL